MTAQLFTHGGWPPHGIAGCDVRPGFVHTDMTADATEDKDDAHRSRRRAHAALGRTAEDRQVGRPSPLRVSGAILYATGSVLFMTGASTSARSLKYRDDQNEKGRDFMNRAIDHHEAAKHLAAVRLSGSSRRALAGIVPPRGHRVGARHPAAASLHQMGAGHRRLSKCSLRAGGWPIKRALTMRAPIRDRAMPPAFARLGRQTGVVAANQEFLGSRKSVMARPICQGRMLVDLIPRRMGAPRSTTIASGAGAPGGSRCVAPAEVDGSEGWRIAWQNQVAFRRSCAAASVPIRRWSHLP